MPNVKNLASEALEELGKSAYDREKHEMRNNKIRGGDDSSLPGDIGSQAWEHKSIKR